MNFRLLLYYCLFLLPCSLLFGLYVSEGVNVFITHKHTVRSLYGKLNVLIVAFNET